MPYLLPRRALQAWESLPISDLKAIKSVTRNDKNREAIQKIIDAKLRKRK